MAGIIVAFSKPENGKNIRSILARNGFEVAAVCQTGAQTLAAAEEMDFGIVVCGSRFADMPYGELRELLSQGLDMLVIAQPAQMTAGRLRNMVFLPMPLKVNELVGTVEMMAQAQRRRRRREKNRPRMRSGAELEILKKAKEILMERNHMDEEEAHRYLQRRSMENGVQLVETAQMVISLEDWQPIE